MTVAQDEIFGPVAVVIPFDGEAEGIRIANDTRYGLAASVWHPEPTRTYEIAEQIHAGTVSINGGGGGPLLGGPFGGYKQSGIGQRVRRLRVARVHAAQDGLLVRRTTLTRGANTMPTADESFRTELRAWLSEHAPPGVEVAATAGDAGAARVAANAARRALGRDPLARRVRRAGRVADPGRDLQRGARPRRRAADPRPGRASRSSARR